MQRKILVGCGAAASALYVLMDIIASRIYQGYSYADQTISELGAFGSPSRGFLILTGAAYDLLMLAFGVGVWLSAGRRRSLRIAAGLLIALAILGATAPFTSMHERAVLAAGGATATDTLHLVSAAIGSALFML